MKIAAIIAEYNPFHNGHAYLIHQARQQGATHIVAVMNGNFTQRGECAVVSKWARAEMALACGADLILELPLAFGAASAERFAFGGVCVAHQLGCVAMLAFGAETAHLPLLQAAAQAVDDRQVLANIKSEIRTGRSFPAARQKAVADHFGEQTAAVLCSPNNILAVEYIKALHALQSNIAPLPVQRVGPAHDSAVMVPGFASASAIRSVATAGQAQAFMPPAAFEIYAGELARRATPGHEKWQAVVLCKLRALTKADFAALPGGEHGLCDRLYEKVKSATGLQALYDAVKTKSVTHSRVRRLVLHAFLGITQEALTDQPYLRVLGLNEHGREILRAAGPGAKPVLRVRELAEHPAFALECRATDQYSAILKKPAPCGREFTEQVIVMG